MSLPDFNHRGTLDKGVHKCDSKEFYTRFCDDNNTIRSKYKDVMEQVFAFAVSRNARSVIIGGSFITNKAEPNDLDCILIVPNDECCNFQPNELLVVEGCQLDIIIINENRKDTIYAFLNMLSKDRFSLDVGMIEVLLDRDKDKSTWDDYADYYSIEKLLEARAAYIHRHIIRGVSKKKMLVTVCNEKEFLFWNYKIAPVVSSCGWIFAPYLYKNECKLDDELQKFKDWITKVYYDYDEPDLCVYADEIGTFFIGRYLVDKSSDKAYLDRIIFSRSLLKTDFDWSGEMTNGQIVKFVINLKSKSAQLSIDRSVMKKLKKDSIYGETYELGFKDERVLNYPYNKIGITWQDFKNDILPLYHIEKNIKENIDVICLENLKEIYDRSISMSDILLNT